MNKLLKIKFNFFIVLFLLQNCTYLYSIVIYPISVTKCGSHLTWKCLDLLEINKIHVKHNTQELSTAYIRIKNFTLKSEKNLQGYVYDGDAPNGIISLNHLFYTPNNEELLKNNKKIFTIRDPRDRLVSGAYWIKKHPHIFPKIASFKIEDIILCLLDKNHLKLEFPNKEEYKNIWQYSINNYKLWMPWMFSNNTLVVKFENLVGEQGGGKTILQLSEINKIANYIGLSISTKKIKQIGSQLFGNTNTFRSGQIGEWKKHFTAQHKQALKENKKACEIIQILKYENDNSWLNN